MKILHLKNIFPNSPAARYNLAVWQKSEDGTLSFIGREVTQAGKAGEPDTGILKLFEMSNTGEIVREKVLWKPLYDGINLEDPRALLLPNDTLIIGVTAVVRNKKGEPVPFPAIVKIDSIHSWMEQLPPFLFIDTFGPGKNITPIDNTTYLFRPEPLDYHHKILVFSLRSQIAEKIGDIEFPTNLPWASFRVGTAMPPIWLSETEALLIFHGITIEMINGHPKYVYTIGRSKLIRKDNVFTIVVAPEPIVTPDDFLNSEGKPLVQELHPELRRVVYSCGGIVKKDSKDILSLYVNVGDRTTFNVEFSLHELKEGLF